MAQWIEAQLAREGEPAVAYLRVPLCEADLVPSWRRLTAGFREAYAALLEGIAQRLLSEPHSELPGAEPEPRFRLSYRGANDELRLVNIGRKGRTVVGRNGQHWGPILAACLTSFQGVVERSVFLA